MKKAVLTFLLLFLGASAAFSATGVNISAEEALTRLINGNKRFVHMKLEHPDQSIEKRLEGLKGQHPFVAVLSCSDSRVPPEVIFDQGLGDIFEIRNAGNILDDHVIGSVEYAVAHLDTALIVVMGHQDCGAVKAAMDNSEETEHIQSIVQSIKPAVEKANCKEADLHECATKINVENVVASIKESEPLLKEYYQKGKINIVGAFYHIDSGKVEFLTK